MTTQDERATVGEIVDGEPETAREHEPSRELTPAARERASVAAAAPQQMDPMTLGQVLAESGFFKDAKTTAQAAVKVMAGRELGFGPIASMTNVHIITTDDGGPNERTTVQIGGALLAAKIQGSERYRFRVVQRTARVCELAFFEKDPITGAWQEQPDHVIFTIEDAARANLAGKPMYKKYPAKMLFWRAVSEGADVYCSDLFGGNSVEVSEDFGPGAAMLEPGGQDRTTGHVGLPPVTAEPQVVDRASGGGNGGGQQPPQASSRRPEQTGPTITAAQRRKLWAEADKAGIKENEQLLKLLIFWAADVEHSDRIPRDKVDTVLAAIVDHEGQLDLIVTEARAGDERARLALQTFMPDALPTVDAEPPAAGADAERIGDEAFADGGQGQLT